MPDANPPPRRRRPPPLRRTPPAAAQLAPREIALESGVSLGASGGSAAHAPLALSAALWLDRDLDAVLRVAAGSAAQTTGRAATAWSGTAGLRWSLAPGPVRPQLLVELGWSRADGPAARDVLAAGLGGALEWFPARDLALALGAAARRSAAGVRLEATLSVGAYF